MSKQEKPKQAYAAPNITVYSIDPKAPDFLTASGEDPDQGEWDAQPEQFIPYQPYNPQKP